MAGKVAVITGANKGLGFAVVKALCQKYDGTIYLTARDKNRGLDAVETLKEIGLNPVFHQLDISDYNSVKKFAEFIKAKHGGVDVLVNNAAILEWDEVYPTYKAAKRSIDINYRSLLAIEEYLYPLLREEARVVNVSSPCAHLSNLKNNKWINILKDPNLRVEEINEFVDEYLESVKNKTFNKSDFADDGKHAEYRVSKIAFTALSMLQQRKYPKISINAVYPGHLKTDMANGGGKVEAEEAAKFILYLILDAQSVLKGKFFWDNWQIIDWLDSKADLGIPSVW
ncbi:unnamed protein product [Arctia plantaginis]|uniref:Uncharacterized protein n=1 Tax=Arctia plantaginis TaxID=874455 RepID=A0A8S0ZHQ4_ARCPL|nr:unnamed protein product [Arctia plantaginis]